jgi:hypothetical protein
MALTHLLGGTAVLVSGNIWDTFVYAWDAVTKMLSYRSVNFNPEGATWPNSYRPRYICTDGTYVYVEKYRYNPRYEGVVKLKASDLSFVAEVDFGSTTYAFYGMATSGAILYVLYGDGKIHRFSCHDLSSVGGPLGSGLGTGDGNINTINDYPTGFAIDAVNFYAATLYPARLTKLARSDGSFLEKYEGAHIYMPYQMVIDGDVIFIGDGNHYSITAFDAPTLEYISDFGQQYGDYPSGMFAVEGDRIYSMILWDDFIAVLDKTKLLAGEGQGGLFNPPETNPVQIEKWDWAAPFSGTENGLLRLPTIPLTTPSRYLRYSVRVVSLKANLFDVAAYELPYRRNVKMKLLIRELLEDSEA